MNKTKKEIKKILKRHSLIDRDIISVSQFEQSDIEFLYSLFTAVKESNGECSRLLRHKVMTALFYEPSTRTSSSFISAMTRLGGGVIPITEGIQYSSVSKGEDLRDTIITLGCLSDVIVLRHPEVGSAQLAADASVVPIINAGDGIGEHPTQAFLDLFTIFDEVDITKPLNIAMVGDLKHGRTVHSLVKLICKVSRNIKFTFVSPEELKMPNDIIGIANAHGIGHEITPKLDFTSPDIFYITRVQKERFKDQKKYLKLKDAYCITKDDLEHMKDTAIIMHPLPRVDEIHTSVDSDHRAVYFKQVRNGLYTRMALLLAVLHNR